MKKSPEKGTSGSKNELGVPFCAKMLSSWWFGEVLLSMGCIVYGLWDNICEWGKGIDLGINCD